jgi:RND family efflux transporter MFP subunit
MNPLGRLAAAWSRLRPWQQGALVIGLGVVSLAALILLRPRPPLQQPPRQVPTVTTVPLELRSGHLSVRGNGTVRPSAEITLASEVAGRVVWVSPSLVSGGRFDRGQALLRVDPADYENAVRAARAEVAQRQVEVLQAEEEVVLAREEYARLQRRTGSDSTAAGGEQSALLFREPQLDAARAALERAEAGLEDASLRLERTQIRAPFTGSVRTESVDRGQYLAPGQAVAQLYATDAVEILVPLSDDDAALIPDLWDTRASGGGASVPVDVYAEYGDQTYHWRGAVDRAESALDELTRAVDVVVRVEGPFARSVDSPRRPPLLLGTYATVDIRGIELDPYAVIPSSAVRDDERIWTVVDDSILVFEPIRFIQEVEDSAYVVAELEAGVQVIVSPLPFATNGMTVQVAQPLETSSSTRSESTRRMETTREDGR